MDRNFGQADLEIAVLSLAGSDIREILERPVEGVVSGEVHLQSIDPSLDAASLARVCVALFLGLQLQKAIDPEADLSGCSQVIASVLEDEWQRERRST